jgi:hypothetical protein
MRSRSAIGKVDARGPQAASRINRCLPNSIGMSGREVSWFSLKWKRRLAG